MAEMKRVFVVGVGMTKVIVVLMYETCLKDQYGQSYSLWTHVNVATY